MGPNSLEVRASGLHCEPKIAKLGSLIGALDLSADGGNLDLFIVRTMSWFFKVLLVLKMLLSLSKRACAATAVVVAYVGDTCLCFSSFNNDTRGGKLKNKNKGIRLI